MFGLVPPTYVSSDENGAPKILRKTEESIVNGLYDRITSYFKKDPRPVENRQLVQNNGEDDRGKKAGRLAKDLYRGAVCFGLSEMSKYIPGHSFKHLLFYRPFWQKYVEYKLNQKLDYRKKIQDSGLAKRSFRLYNGVATNLCKWVLNGKVSMLFFDRLQNKIAGTDKNTQSPFPLQFSQVLKNVLFTAFNAIAENLKVDGQIEDRFKGKDASWGEKMIYRMHLLEKIPKGMPNLKQASLDKYNIYDEIDKSLDTYLKRVSYKLLNVLGSNFTIQKPSGFSFFSQLVSYLAYKIEVKDQLEALTAWYFKDVWIKPFLDPHNLFLLILSSCGVKTTELEKEGYGIASSSDVLKTGCDFIDLLSKNAKQSAFDDVYKRSKLQKSKKNNLGLIQDDLARKKLEDHFTELFYFLLKGKQVPKGKTAYQHFKTAMDNVPFVGQTFNTIHMLGFGLYYCTTYFFQSDNKSMPMWIFKNLTGRKLARSLSKAFIHLLEHPMWILVILQAVNTLEESLFDKQAKTYETKNSKTFQENTKIVCKFLLLNVLNEDDKKVCVRDESNAMVKKAMKQISGPFVESIKHYLDHLPTKDEVIKFAKESLSDTFEEYLLYMEMCLHFRNFFIEIESDYKFWQMWFQEHLIEWCDSVVVLHGYKPSKNYRRLVPKGLKEWDDRAKQIWTHERQKRVSKIRGYLERKDFSKILKGPSQHKKVKQLEKEFVVIENYAGKEEEADDEFVQVDSTDRQTPSFLTPSSQKKRDQIFEKAGMNTNLFNEF